MEVANKNVKKYIQKMVINQRDWNEVLPFALHAYRIVVRTLIEATPYSLVYGGSDVVGSVNYLNKSADRL